MLEGSEWVCVDGCGGGGAGGVRAALPAAEVMRQGPGAAGGACAALCAGGLQLRSTGRALCASASPCAARRRCGLRATTTARHHMHMAA